MDLFNCLRFLGGGLAVGPARNRTFPRQPKRMAQDPKTGHFSRQYNPQAWRVSPNHAPGLFLRKIILLHRYWYGKSSSSIANSYGKSSSSIVFAPETYSSYGPIGTEKPSSSPLIFIDKLVACNFGGCISLLDFLVLRPKY